MFISTRFSVALLLGLVVGAACSTDETNEVLTAESEAATAVDVGAEASETNSDDLETLINEIESFVADDSAATTGGLEAHFLAIAAAGSPDGIEVEARLAECDALQAASDPADRTLVMSLGEDFADAALVGYLEARETREALYLSTCEELSSNSAVLQADVDGSRVDGGPPVGSRLYEIETERTAATDAVISACFELQAAIDLIGEAALSCVPSVSDLSGDSADGEGALGDERNGPSFVVGDALSGPAGTEIEPVLLAAGTNEFGWFTPAFTIVNDADLGVAASADSVLFMRQDWSVFELHVIDQVSDPSALNPSPFEMGGEIPVPSDVDEWLEQLPIVFEEEVLEVGGLRTTYRHIEIDPSADVAAVALWTQPDRPQGPLGVDPDQSLHLWHIEHPEGTIFVFEQEFSFFAPEEPITASSLAEFVF